MKLQCIYQTYRKGKSGTYKFICHYKEKCSMPNAILTISSQRRFAYLYKKQEKKDCLQNNKLYL